MSQSYSDSSGKNWIRLESYTDHLDKTTFQEEVVGGFSGLTKAPDGRIGAVSDRSVMFYLDAETLDPVQAIRLRDELRQRVDCEAVTIDQGNILIATEKPEILRYDAAGKMLGILPMPSRYRVTPVGDARLNEVFEGMTLLDDFTLVASLENSLLTDEKGLLRFQCWERSDATAEFKPTTQYCYQVEPGLLVSDIAATGDGRLLVLERGFDKATGNIVRLYLTDFTGVGDVSEIAELEAGAPVLPKQLLGDLADLPPSGAVAKQPQKNPLMQNYEAMAVTEHLADGSIRLLVASDDNDSEVQITRFLRLRIELPDPA
ncbi:esterase-like activity of phytase family protein [Paractinoplanes hotanensis]|uniref:Esterase-like activity of phytase family protein n=1 Tax=Paractinoplanes hotanensis TaxID=2906497 RepID=A0ABT0YBL4_9ACTN|nr:esterase-like activity of phytase family protein [Actinoplanes hotanensis]MCM4083451.1 esterase-like activity of phytase family protein [Actinoplanes hotanensis]